MVRGIKFRGQAVSDVEVYGETIYRKGQWVTGNLITNEGHPYIVGNVADVDSEYIALEWWVRVDPATVGQYTGLKDKNGREIYEGDIVIGLDLNGTAYRIRFWDGDATFGGESAPYNGIAGAGTQTIGLNNSSDWLEIIGNIHDNPELLKEGE